MPALAVAALGFVAGWCSGGSAGIVWSRPHLRLTDFAASSVEFTPGSTTISGFRSTLARFDQVWLPVGQHRSDAEEVW